MTVRGPTRPVSGTRPRARPAPRLSDAELVCLAVAQVLLGYRSERRWLRAVTHRLGTCSPMCAARPPTTVACAGPAPWSPPSARPWPCPAPPGGTSGGCWTPPGPLRPEPPDRPPLGVGWAGDGYDPSHSRWYWGLKPYLLACPDGLPVAWCLADPGHGEREVAEDLLDRAARQRLLRPGMVVLADKGLAGRSFAQTVAELGARLVRPDRADEPTRFGNLGGVRQWIEAIIDTSKTSSVWSSMAPTPSKASGYGSPSGWWPWPPGSGSTGSSAPRSSARWSPTTTNTSHQSTSVI
jgi:hypothetical protein